MNPAEHLLRAGTDAATAAPQTRHSSDANRDSQLTAQRALPGFLLRETFHPAGASTETQVYSSAHLLYVIEGALVESAARGAFGESGSETAEDCAAGTLRVLPAGYAHVHRFTADTHCLLVRLEPSAMERCGPRAGWLERPGAIGGVASGWLAARLHREFHSRDEAASLALEGLLLQILAEIARIRCALGPAVPRWLRTAREYIESKLPRPAGLVEIARASGVHRVHLAREFRRYFGSTIGEYIRRRRVEHACHLIAHSSLSLAEIGIQCGFSDQSHFSATFRRHVGVTPARFRTLSPTAQDAGIAAST